MKNTPHLTSRAVEIPVADSPQKSIRALVRRGFLTCLLSLGIAFGMISAAFADSYDDVWMECYYITQCSATSANSSIGFGNSKASYGILNDWRIGNGTADFVRPGEASIGAIGLLYGYNRLVSGGRSNSDLDWRAKEALSGFFWSWARNADNRIGYAYPEEIVYDSAGNMISKTGADARVTAEVLIAMRKYCLLSPNGDRTNYQSQEYSRAYGMASFVDTNVNSWSIDRSYAVAALHAFANWASAVGDTANSTYFHNRANTISGWLASAQDQGTWGNYYDYLDGGNNGVYNGSVSQIGFAPYEFNARWAGENYAKKLADWWNHGQAYNGYYLSEQSGTYAGGVHQAIHQTVTASDRQAYPGSALQLADALWKIASATGNYNDTYAEAWWHYNFAKTGSGCWVNNTTSDPSGFIGGFVDWVNVDTNERPAVWQRFVDTSAYFIVATEELVFSSAVDYAN